MSSAILYAAIVAIWACVLVPRWLRRPHETPAEPGSVPGQEDTAAQADVTDPASPDAPDRQDAGDPDAATLSEQEAGVPYADPVAWEYKPGDEVIAVASGADAGHTPAGPSAGGAEASLPGTGASAGGAEASLPGAGAAAGDAVLSHHGVPADHRDVAGRTGAGPHVAHHRRTGRVADVAPHPVVERSRVLKARRRGLILLIAMAVGTIGATFVGLLPVAFLAAPLAVLVIYLLLLRAAAKANAENARRRAGAHAHAARAARARAARTRRNLAPENSAAGAAQRTAKVIDLGAVAASFDQPYDQYADAEARAVGD